MYIYRSTGSRLPLLALRLLVLRRLAHATGNRQTSVPCMPHPGTKKKYACFARTKVHILLLVLCRLAHAAAWMGVPFA